MFYVERCLLHSDNRRDIKKKHQEKKTNKKKINFFPCNVISQNFIYAEFNGIFSMNINFDSKTRILSKEKPQLWY